MNDARSPRTSIRDQLDRFVERLGVPAAGIATIGADGTLDADVIGSTRRGDTEPVTIDQQWHIGSCAKSVTAAVYALLVEQGRASWDAPVTELVPDLAHTIHPGWATPTIDEVLQCRAGIRPNLTSRTFRHARSDTRTPIAQRTAAVHDALQTAPTRHGRFRYSNLGYVLVGAAIDRVADSYEHALHKLVLEPLGVTSVGFGPPPEIWGHRARLHIGPIGIARGRPSPPTRPSSDNPEVYTPAGRLHLSLPDWATIVHRLFLDTHDSLLTTDTIDRLLHAPDGNAMAMGWAAPTSQFPDATVAMQGSNTYWAATALLDTHRRRAALVVTNDGRTRTLTISARTANELLAP